MRIAKLAGRELSNHQISDLLDISPGVVAAGLYRVFFKLGVTSRSQVTQALMSSLG